MKRISLIVSSVCLVLVLVGCGQRSQVAEVGKLAPDFTLVDRKGKTWNLSQLAGQVVFVNFWATWCPSCIEEMPSMERLYRLLPPDKFKMLAILNKDEPAFADNITTKLGLTFPILTGSDNKAGKAYGLTGVPETYIIDKQGILREKFIGPVQWDTPAVQQKMMHYINQ